VFLMSRHGVLTVRCLLTCTCVLALSAGLLTGFSANVYGQVPQAAPDKPQAAPDKPQAAPDKLQAAPDKLDKKPSVFRVKYASDSTLYIDAGRNADLQEGMKLSVVNPPPDGVVSDGIRFRGYEHVAELRVTTVADSSAVCEILTANGDVHAGQLAILTADSVDGRRQAESAVEDERYPIVMTFTYGDPLEEEVRLEQAKKSFQESPMQRIRGRFGFTYGGTQESGGLNSKQLGVVLDSDMTHLFGTYWNFTGYWRGNFASSTATIPGTNPVTLTDLINRTYHLGFTYQNPDSPTTIGIGRLFIPWAPSLSTIDGGYLGRKISRIATIGFFAGSTPDPSSWSYNPNQHIAGTFVNFERGDFEHSRLYTTAGIAVTAIQWKVARQFAFFENNFTWKRYFSLYSSLQADEARTSPLVNGGSNPTGISQSYSAVHVQPLKRIGFGVNHNYFRNLPTFDPRLVVTGLLNQYLFQGFSGDVRLDLPMRIGVYASLGRSKTTTDTKNSLNEAYGLTLGNLLKTGLLLDLHYSKFNSSFGSGKYESISVSRTLTDSLHIQVYGGHQIFDSPLSTNSKSDFVTGVVDWSLGPRYFLEGNYSWYNGTSLGYTQWSMIFGYRFGGFRK
jgi:hypothetical protein